jgi:hypothetical protein
MTIPPFADVSSWLSQALAPGKNDPSLLPLLGCLGREDTVTALNNK